MNSPMNVAGAMKLHSEADKEKPFDYIAEANVTASNTYHGGNVHAELFKDTMRTAIRSLAQLDLIKKSLFYGRELPEELRTGSYGNRDFGDSFRFPQWLHSDDAKGVLILHCIIGMATECGELLEMVYEACVEGKPFDLTHFCEEIGDNQWYAAIGLGAADATFDSVHRTNIAKLRKRFPNAFNEFDANNRDLIGERAILERKGKATAHIENWEYDPRRECLWGEVSKHPNQEYLERDGNTKAYVHTSRIVKLDRANKICETQNTIYTLGKSTLLA